MLIAKRKNGTAEVYLYQDNVVFQRNPGEIRSFFFYKMITVRYAL